MKLLEIVFGGVSLVSLMFAVPASAAGPNSAAGKKIFEDNCAACHGIKGDGNGPAARAISGAKPRNFVSEPFKYGATDEAVSKTISEGVKGSAMPPWAHLSKADIAAVVTYIRSLKSKP